MKALAGVAAAVVLAATLTAPAHAADTAARKGTRYVTSVDARADDFHAGVQPWFEIGYKVRRGKVREVTRLRSHGPSTSTKRFKGWHDVNVRVKSADKKTLLRPNSTAAIRGYQFNDDVTINVRGRRCVVVNAWATAELKRARDREMSAQFRICPNGSKVLAESFDRVPLLRAQQQQ